MKASSFLTYRSELQTKVTVTCISHYSG